MKKNILILPGDPPPEAGYHEWERHRYSDCPRSPAPVGILTAAAMSVELELVGSDQGNRLILRMNDR